MNYVEEAMRTNTGDYSKVAERVIDPTVLRMLHAAMGLVTEAGELMDALKKHIIYGAPLDRVNMVEELGDTSWYHALGANTLHVSLEEIHSINIAKLRARYPNKFTEQDATHRDLGTERAILEGGSH